jgi:uracil-DNA glycosylase
VGIECEAERGGGIDKEKGMDLLEEIIRCEHIRDCLIRANIKNPCYDLVNSQGIRSYDNFQVPEPWSGDLEHAKILFISSNPSISKRDKGSPFEQYPVASWDDKRISDFFTNRFKDDKGYAKNGIYYRQNDGNFNSISVRYWASVKKIAEGLLLRKAIPGVDYALTEVVHCKSKGEKWVAEAAEQCTRLYLGKIVNKTNAQVIVVLGNKARDAIRSEYSEYDIPEGAKIYQVSLFNRTVHLLFMPHPNAWKPKALENVFSREEIEKLTGILGE